jgi:hypothetical protein
LRDAVGLRANTVTHMRMENARIVMAKSKSRRKNDEGYI